MPVRLTSQGVPSGRAKTLKDARSPVAADGFTGLPLRSTVGVLGNNVAVLNAGKITENTLPRLVRQHCADEVAFRDVRCRQ